MFRYLDVYINLWFDYMRLKCHLLDTFANGICLYVDERAPRAAAAWLRIVSFSYWIGSDWIDWSSDCSKHKNEKRTREREKNLKRTWGQRTQIVTFQWALLNVLHFNTFRLAPSRGVLCTVPHLGQRVWFQHSKNHKPKNKIEKPTTPILIGPKQSNQWIRYTFIFCLLFISTRKFFYFLCSLQVALHKYQ